MPYKTFQNRQQYIPRKTGKTFKTILTMMKTGRHSRTKNSPRGLRYVTVTKTVARRSFYYFVSPFSDIDLASLAPSLLFINAKKMF